MRPPGEISMAILHAAQELARDVDGQRRGPTLKELAALACVGTRDALHTVKNLTRAGKLERVHERRVTYRNRPVLEYAPKRRAVVDAEHETIDVASVFSVWARG